MLKQNWRLLSRLERLGDNLWIVFAFFFAYYGRDSLIFWNETLGLKFSFAGTTLAPIKDYYIVLLTGLLSYSVILTAMGAYESMRMASVWRLFYVAFASSLLVGFCLAAVLFLLKVDISRSFIGLFVVLAGCGLALERYVVLNLLRFWRRRGRNFRSVIICGVGRQAIRLARNITERSELGIHIRSFADLRDDAGTTRDGGNEEVNTLKAELDGKVTVGRVLLGVPAVAQALKDHAIDEVIFTDVVTVMPQVEELILACSDQGVRTTIAADLFSIGLIKSEISRFCGIPLIHFQTPPGDSWLLVVKRVLDIVLSAFALVLLSPLLLLLAIGVKTTPGPVLFRQTRVGLNGRLFQMLKFRSMCEGSDAGKDELRQHNEMKGPVFKMANDPRVTPFGRFLRRFSLDELPQLYNVLVGEMSLVGPRPPVPGEVSLYERRSRRRLSMRPGLTCIWQVSGRNEISDFEQWVKLDLEYIDNWSLLGDLWLLIRTVPAVLIGRGAR
jgi:exopolysaccharide biosynthesis polyprenyl glycosylphosphotransferase